MKFNWILLVSLILFVLNSGCKTFQKVLPDRPVERPTAALAPESLVSIIYPEAWAKSDVGQQQKNISTALEKAVASKSQAVIFYTEAGHEALAFAVEKAFELRLKLFAGIDLTKMDGKTHLLSPAELKTQLKSQALNLVNNYSIDGISLRFSDLSADLIEDLVVEAMLVKPYLINSILYSGEKGHQNAILCLEEGIVDFIIPSKEGDSDSYTEKIKESDIKKKIQPEQVVGLDLSALFPENPHGQTVYINKRQKVKITDSEGRIGFIVSKSDSIEIETSTTTIRLQTRDWSPPFKYAVLPDGKTQRKSPWVEFRRIPQATTDVPSYDFLAKTDYPAKIWINGDSLKQYKTGIFFNKVNFNEGANRVRATVLTQDSLTVFYEREFIYENRDRRRQAFPLWINERSVQPNTEMALLPEDIIRVSFEGSKGQIGYIELKNEGIKVPCQREDFEDYSLYRAELPLQKLSQGKPFQLTMNLVSSVENSENNSIELLAKNTIQILAPADFPMVRIKEKNARLTYNMGAPRLGGPIRAELGPGVLLKTNGKIGDNFRVRLSGVEYGIIHKSDVEVLPAETVRPTYIISSMSCGPSADADIVSIPYLEPVPYEVHAEPDQKRIVLTLYGVETASTWITHRTGRKIIDKVTWKQTTPETYQVYVNLNTSNIWGYDLVQNGKNLVLRIKYPPVFDLNHEKPLTGLKISIEAGHGGSNTGAVGLSGILEKDINLDLSLRLEKLCRAMGAEVFQVRDTDKDMALTYKRELAITSGADLHLSIHANAGGGGGYLRASGTSTYYHNPFWAPFAETVYRRLLEMDLTEFGVVGSFNYTVTRMTQMPSILVEQAFLSHAEDEEKMADPEFRQLMAQKIYEGMRDYLRGMKQ